MSKRTTVIFDEEASDALDELRRETHMSNVSDLVRASLTVFRSLVRADSEGKCIYLRDRNNEFWQYSPHRRLTGPQSLVKVTAAEVLGQQSKAKKPGTKTSLQHGAL